VGIAADGVIAKGKLQNGKGKIILHSSIFILHFAMSYG
jgi:hypothetical protein